MSDTEQPPGRFCPTCGTLAGAANFCPECGTDLSAVRRVLRGGEPAAPPSASTSSTAGKTTGGRRDAGSSTSQAPAPPAAAWSRGISPWVLFGGAAIALAIIVAVVFVGLRTGSSSGSVPPSSTGASASAVPADTSGTYQQLVTRANALYDKGAAALGKSQFQQSANYFGAAATIYQAAWKKEAGDLNVGTDWATSVFYSGDIQGALAIVEMVLAEDPTFQPALYNKGDFLANQAQLADQSGMSADASKLNAEAKAAYQQAAAADPASSLGKQAAAAAAALP
jgi:hypothetical protein